MNSKRLQSIIKEDQAYLFQNYPRLPVCFVRGDGCYLYDQDNKKYIDFFSGIAVTSLGHRNRALTRTLHRQIETLIHTSNWFYNREQNAAGRLIADLSFPGKTLFVNSGTEANEAAIKLARRYGISQNEERYRIITFTNSFHGRTYGGMSATAQKKIHEGFGPLVPGFTYLPYNDTAAFAREIKRGKDICAVMFELVQGEGGIVIADQRFVKEIFSICSKNNVLTIIDEVQTGVGRTGTLFAYQRYGVVPDIITLAKGLGGGIPVGAIHAKNFLAEYFPRGAHGTTFGGSHLVCTAVAAVLSQMKRPSFLAHVNRVGDMIKNHLSELSRRVDFIKDIRGLGLHIGVELTKPGAPLVSRALERGLIINCTAERVIRIMPPLTISASAVNVGMRILERVFLEEGGTR